AQVRASLDDALRHVMLAAVPISVLLALLSRPVVYLLYSHTKMSHTDLDQTSLALELFLIGTIAWGTQQIIARGFYALGDTITPTVLGSVLTIASIPLYWLGQKYFAFLGLAGASSAAVIVYTAVLWAWLFRRLEIPFAPLAYYFARLVVASCIAWASCV